MNALEIKKMKVELIRVGAAKAELELRIEICKDEINRVSEHIKIQEAKEQELTEKLKDL